MEEIYQEVNALAGLLLPRLGSALANGLPWLRMRPLEPATGLPSRRHLEQGQ